MGIISFAKSWLSEAYQQWNAKDNFEQGKIVVSIVTGAVAVFTGLNAAWVYIDTQRNQDIIAARKELANSKTYGDYLTEYRGKVQPAIERLIVQDKEESQPQSSTKVNVQNSSPEKVEIEFRYPSSDAPSSKPPKNHEITILTPEEEEEKQKLQLTPENLVDLESLTLKELEVLESLNEEEQQEVLGSLTDKQKEVLESLTLKELEVLESLTLEQLEVLESLTLKELEVLESLTLKELEVLESLTEEQKKVLGSLNEEQKKVLDSLTLKQKEVLLSLTLKKLLLLESLTLTDEQQKAFKSLTSQIEKSPYFLRIKDPLKLDTNGNYKDTFEFLRFQYSCQAFLGNKNKTGLEVYYSDRFSDDIKDLKAVHQFYDSLGFAIRNDVVKFENIFNILSYPAFWESERQNNWDKKDYIWATFDPFFEVEKCLKQNWFGKNQPLTDFSYNFIQLGANYHYARIYAKFDEGNCKRWLWQIWKKEDEAYNCQLLREIIIEREKKHIEDGGFYKLYDIPNFWFRVKSMTYFITHKLTWIGWIGWLLFVVIVVRVLCFLLMLITNKSPWKIFKQIMSWLWKPIRFLMSDWNDGLQENKKKQQNKQLLERIDDSNPKEPTIKNSKITVKWVLQSLAEGKTEVQIKELAKDPIHQLTLTDEDIKACYYYASTHLTNQTTNSEEKS